MDLEKITQKIKEYSVKNIIPGNVVKTALLDSPSGRTNLKIQSDTGTYCLRAYSNENFLQNNRAEYEFNILKLLAGNQISPAPYFLDKDFLGGMIISELITGNELQPGFDNYKAAGLFSKLHSLKIEKPEGIEAVTILDLLHDSKLFTVPDISRRHLYAKKVLLDFYDKTEKIVNDNSEIFRDDEVCLVNRKVKSSDFSINSDRCYLLDWEKTVLSHFYLDLAHFISPTNRLNGSYLVFNDNEKNSFLRVYHSISDRKVFYDEFVFKTFLFEGTVVLGTISWCYMAFQKIAERNIKVVPFEMLKNISYILDNVDAFIEKTSFNNF